jgi:hypothetical protein
MGAPIEEAADGVVLDDDGLAADALVAHAVTDSKSAKATSPAESNCRMDDTGPR